MKIKGILPDYHILIAGAEELDSRLRNKIQPGEAVSLLVVLLLLGVFAWNYASGVHLPIDYDIYLQAGSGDTSDWYYGYWIIPVFSLFTKLPHTAGFLVWGVINILCTFAAARIFGGKALLVLVSYQFFASIYFGQVTGVILGGLALLWWGLKHERGYLAGLGMAIAFAKFHIGFPIAIALFLFCGVSWRVRLKTLVVPALFILGSLLIFPGWPLELVQRLVSTPPHAEGSISPWNLIGAFSLVFWIPPLLLRMEPERRIAALAAATVLGVPYFQLSDLFFLFMLPSGYLPLLGLLAFSTSFWKVPPHQVLVVIPLVFYLAAIIKLPARKKGSEPMNLQD